MIKSARGKQVSVECVFQSSKVFEGDIQYLDLLKYHQEKQKRLQTQIIWNGNSFSYLWKKDKEWGTKPITAYYDWLYVNALNQHTEFHEELLKYSAFSDIEFNPEKSLNCQAYSVALFCALYRRGILQDVLKSQKDFLSIYKDYKIDNSYTSRKQLGMFL